MYFKYKSKTLTGKKSYANGKTFHILTSQVSCVPKISSSFIIIITAELST